MTDFAKHKAIKGANSHYFRSWWEKIAKYAIEDAKVVNVTLWEPWFGIPGALCNHGYTSCMDQVDEDLESQMVAAARVHSNARSRLCANRAAE